MLLAATLSACGPGETLREATSNTLPPAASSTEQAAPSPKSDAGVADIKDGRVTRVVDGDTARIWFDGEEHKVRLIGIDTPESTIEIEPYGKAASAYTRRAIPPGTRVYLEMDAEPRDRYGRILAYIWLDRPRSRSDKEIRAKMLNARIVLDGYAQQLTIPPNVRYADHFRRYVAEAREARLGLWSDTEGSSKSAPGDPEGAPSPTPRVATGGSARVWVTPSGSKYHRQECRWLGDDTRSKTVSQARQEGYDPCKTCDP